jgi:PPOX class probable F420-dependent enzyme
MWYVLDEDGTIVMNTQVHLQKMKNIRRDSRIAFCVEDGFRYVSINGTLDVNPEQAVVHSDLEKLATRYVSDEATRQEYITRFKSQNRVALRIRPERIIEQL